MYAQQADQAAEAPEAIAAFWASTYASQADPERMLRKSIGRESNIRGRPHQTHLCEPDAAAESIGNDHIQKMRHPAWKWEGKNQK